MDPKMHNILTSPLLDFYMFGTPASSGISLKKNCAAHLRSNRARVPIDPPLTTNGTTLDKNHFPHTRDL